MALAIGVVLCAVQPLAVLATVWELARHIPSAQAVKIRSLGFDPTVGVAVNFCFAASASLLAVWAYRVARGSASRGGPTRTVH